MMLNFLLKKHVAFHDLYFIHNVKEESSFISSVPSHAFQLSKALKMGILVIWLNAHVNALLLSPRVHLHQHSYLNSGTTVLHSSSISISTSSY